MDIKLNVEQRSRANAMIERLAGADIEEFVFEFIATRDACNKMRKAINMALADSESGQGGWGPDITVCAYLREALDA